MHTDREPVDISALSEMGYEKRDVNMGAIAKWIVAFFALAAIFAFMAMGFYRWLAPEQNRIGHSKFEPKTRRVPVAPNPLLQNNTETKVDIQRMRQDEVGLLTSYQWVDQNGGVVRMPIERAKELIVERGANIGPSNSTPVRRPDASPRNVTGQGPADKAPGSSNAGDTAPRTDIPTGAAAPSSNAPQGGASTPVEPATTGGSNAPGTGVPGPAVSGSGRE